MRGGRWIAGAGCVYIVAWLAGLGIGFATGAPGPVDLTEALAAYFAGHRETAMVQAYLLDGIAGVALIAFVAALAAALRRFEGESSTLSSIALGTGTAAGAVSLLQGLFTQVLADRVASTGDRAVVRALFDLNNQGDTYKLLALAAFIAAVSALALRTHAVPSWLAWTGAPLAVALVVAGWNFAISAPVQLLAYAVLLVLLLCWVAAWSVLSLQRAE